MDLSVTPIGLSHPLDSDSFIGPGGHYPSPNVVMSATRYLNCHFDAPESPFDRYDVLVYAAPIDVDCNTQN
jgi:hypothetical protein